MRRLWLAVNVGIRAVFRLAVDRGCDSRPRPIKAGSVKPGLARLDKVGVSLTLFGIFDELTNRHRIGGGFQQQPRSGGLGAESFYMFGHALGKAHRNSLFRRSQHVREELEVAACAPGIMPEHETGARR